LPVEFAELLIAAGYDALTVVSQHLKGKEDTIVLKTCIREGRILVTLDLDFGDIHAYPPGQHHGLMVFRVARQDKQHLIEIFKRAIPLLKREPIDKRLWIIEETRIRIRGEVE